MTSCEVEVDTVCDIQILVTYWGDNIFGLNILFQTTLDCQQAQGLRVTIYLNPVNNIHDNNAIIEICTKQILDGAGCFSLKWYSDNYHRDNYSGN